METSKINVTLGHKRHKTNDSVRKEKKQSSSKNWRAAVAYFKLGLSINVLIGTANKRDGSIPSPSFKNFESAL